MTGRGAGYCAGYGVPGYANAMPGRGMAGRGGFGGRGRGWRHGFHATGLPGWARFGWAPPYGVPYGPAPAGAEMGDETSVLREQAEYLQEALADVQKRLAELESGSSE